MAKESDNPQGNRRTPHSQERAEQGRRIGPAINDGQRAGPNDVYIQPDGRWIVRGPKGREHVFATDGQHLTSVDRSNAAHQSKIGKGERRRATPEEFELFKELMK